MAKKKAESAAEEQAFKTIAAPIVIGEGVVPKGKLKDVPVDDIIDPRGPSDRMERPGDSEEIAEVARSMREVGQLQPVMVEEIGDGSFRRVFGHRRIAAARLNGAKTVLAIVVPTLAPDVRRTIVAVENIQRKDLNPAEEHLAVAELLELQVLNAAVQVGAVIQHGAHMGHKFTAELAKSVNEAAAVVGTNTAVALSIYRRDFMAMPDVRARACEIVAAMLAKPSSWVRDRMYIGRLSLKARALVLAGKLPLVHAREIAKVADPELRDELAAAYAAGGDDSISDTEAGPLEELQTEVANRVFSLKQVPWQVGVAFAGKPACDGCPNNSATSPGLFEHGGDASTEMHAGIGRGIADATKGDVCTDHRCFAEKLRAAKSLLASTAKSVVDSEKQPSKTATEVLKPAAIREKVEARRATAKASPLKRGNATPTAADVKKAAMRDARNQWVGAMEARANALEKKLVSLLSKTPGALACFKIFKETKLVQASQGVQPGDQIKSAAAIKALLAHVKTPTIAGIVKLEQAAGLKFGLVDAYYDGPSGLADIIAAELGIDMGKAPTVEQFLPKDIREMPKTKRVKALIADGTNGEAFDKAAHHHKDEEDEE